MQATVLGICFLRLGDGVKMLVADVLVSTCGLLVVMNSRKIYIEHVDLVIHILCERRNVWSHSQVLVSSTADLTVQ
jgi:hypothetical protein